LTEGKGLWSNVIHQKYIKPELVEEWIRNLVKKWQNASIVWKAMVIIFPLNVKSLAWKVGKGTRVRIGIDPWVGCKEGFNHLGA
jgi:hypothetical protein